MNDEPNFSEWVKVYDGHRLRQSDVAQADRKSAADLTGLATGEGSPQKTNKHYQLSPLEQHVALDNAIFWASSVNDLRQGVIAQLHGIDQQQGLDYETIFEVMRGALWALIASDPITATGGADREAEIDLMQMARDAAASTRPNSPWAKAVAKGLRDDSDEVRAAMAGIAAHRAALDTSAAKEAGK